MYRNLQRDLLPLFEKDNNLFFFIPISREVQMKDTDANMTVLPY